MKKEGNEEKQVNENVEEGRKNGKGERVPRKNGGNTKLVRKTKMKIIYRCKEKEV